MYATTESIVQNAKTVAMSTACAAPDRLLVKVRVSMQLSGLRCVSRGKVPDDLVVVASDCYSSQILSANRGKVLQAEY